MPVAFYENAIRLLERTQHRRRDGLPQSFQTNATLLDANWCDFVLRHDIHLGVSVDGPGVPARSRIGALAQGQGTLDRVLRGIHLLNERQIPFHVITVLTADSLSYPDELFDFYQEHQIVNVAFNVEEIEGPNTTSSLLGDQMRGAVPALSGALPGPGPAAEPPLKVREFETSAGALVGVRYGPGSRTQENKPWAIVNVDCEGNFSTYSPELLGISSKRLRQLRPGQRGHGSAGRRERSPSISGSWKPTSAAAWTMCRESCSYFAFCGGGPPANKYFENGTFASTETLFCRLHKQVCLDVSLARLERAAAPGGR